MDPLHRLALVKMSNVRTLSVVLSCLRLFSGPDLRSYGKVKMTSVTPCFAIKTRRADRSIVFINVCLSSEVPLTSELPPYEELDTKLHYLVGGPVKELPVSAEEQAFLDKEGIHTHSIYDVAVHPAVIQEAQDDPSQEKKEVVSHGWSVIIIMCKLLCVLCLLVV